MSVKWRGVEGGEDKRRSNLIKHEILPRSYSIHCFKSTGTVCEPWLGNWLVSFLLSTTISSMATPPYIKRQDSNSQSPPGELSVTKKRRKGATRLSCAECRRWDFNPQNFPGIHGRFIRFIGSNFVVIAMWLWNLAFDWLPHLMRYSSRFLVHHASREDALLSAPTVRAPFDFLPQLLTLVYRLFDYWPR